MILRTEKFSIKGKVLLKYFSARILLSYDGYESIRSIIGANNQDVEHPGIAKHVVQSNNNLNTHEKYTKKNLSELCKNGFSNC